MEALGAEWVMGTMRARRKWRKQEQGGGRDTEKQNRVGWRQRDQSRVGWGVRSRTDTRTQGAVGDSGNGAGHQDQDGGTGSKTGMRTVGAGLQPGSLGAGWRQGHSTGWGLIPPGDRWLLKVPMTSQVPGNGDNWGGQHRVGAHRGMSQSRALTNSCHR